MKRLLAGIALPAALACASPQPEPVIDPPGPAASAERQGRPLSSAILDVVGGEADHHAVVVRVLATGRQTTLREGRVFYAASLFKLPIMVETFRQREKGQLSFDEELLVSEEDAALDLGTMAALGYGVGQRIPVGRLLEMMITASDNVSAAVLYRRLGGANVAAGLAELGLRATSVQTSDLPTTAADMATLLEAIARRRAVSPAASDEMAALLKGQSLRGGIPAGVPAGVVVGNKTGSWSDAAHDVGIVYAPFGTYVLVILSDLRYENPALPAISRLVYECLAEQDAFSSGGSEIACEPGPR